jgi:TetR/AcrR family transcriptional regulator, repressor for neighboring sulfatase
MSSEATSGDLHPSGRDDVTAALVASARRLFTLRSPSSVTIKEIAADAGVNHGLVHRHIGSKLDLARLVIDDAAAEVRETLPSSDDPSDYVFAIIKGALSQPVFSRVLGWAVLEGISPSELASSSGLIRDAGSALAMCGVADAQQAVAELAVSTLGWTMFEEHLLAGALAGRNRDSVRQAHLDHVRHQIERLLNPSESAS